MTLDRRLCSTLRELSKKQKKPVSVIANEMLIHCLNSEKEYLRCELKNTRSKLKFLEWQIEKKETEEA